MLIPITVLILTKNEEQNLPYCLRSVNSWSDDIVVLDSGSTDRTVSLAKEQGAVVFHRAFDNYAAQRTYAVHQLPIKHNWILFLDADEWLDDGIKREIDNVLNSPTAASGYFINLQFIFMGRWIRHGGYDACTKLVLFRKDQLVAIERDMDELVIVNGPTGKLNQPIMHQDRKPVQFWYEKHVRYVPYQVADLTKSQQQKQLAWRDAHTKRDRKRWVKEQVWVRIPALIRPFLYFFYRYFVQLGFLDGTAGFIYHFSHAFLYQFMIAAVYVDETNKSRQ